MTQIIAHRGLRNEFPENTLAGIAAALKLDIHGVEFDVELAKDAVPVVLHQETVVPDAQFCQLEQAPRDYVSRDWVIEHESSDIVRLDAGSWLGEAFANQHVPTLEEVLALDWGSCVAFIELKDATYWRTQRDLKRPKQVVDAVLPVLLKYSGNVNTISFNPEILSLLSERAPVIPKTLALWTEWRGKQEQAIAEAVQCGATTISLPDLLVLEDPAWVREAHERRLEIHVYPVSPARGEPEFELWTAESQISKWQTLEALHVDAIISDFARESLPPGSAWK